MTVKDALPGTTVLVGFALITKHFSSFASPWAYLLRSLASAPGSYCLSCCLCWFVRYRKLRFSHLRANADTDETPYPTVSKSISWIVNVSYVTGGGPEQRLDLYVPTDRHGEPLVIYVHGGSFEHGDKAGDSINPNDLQWLWQGYAMASD